MEGVNPARQEVEDALRFTRAPVRRGHRPWAAPSARLNGMATRVEDTFENIRRDGPRRLNEGTVPYWQTLPVALHHPVIEAARPGLVSKKLAELKQGAVNSAVGICAMVLALYHAGRLRGEYAQLILGAHALHVLQAIGTVGVSVAVGLLVLL